MTRLRTRLTVMATVLTMLGLCMALPAPVWSQTPTAPMPRVRAIWQQAREAYARSEYELAGRLYQQVQAQQQQLTPNERTDLMNLVRQNNIALQAQQHGRAQIRQAMQALDSGNEDKAAALLRQINANQYMSAADKQVIEQLQSRLRVSTATPDEADYQTLLNAARSAFKEGDLDAAEGLAREAEKKQGGILPSWMQPWNDSPARILREVEAARAAGKPSISESMADSKQPARSGPLQAVRNMFNWRARKTASQEDMEPDPQGAMQTNTLASTPPMQVKSNVQTATPMPVQPAVPSHNPMPMQPTMKPTNPMPVAQPPRNTMEKQDGATLLAQGRQLFKQGLLDEAEKLCTRAEVAGGNWGGLFDDSPSRLRADIQRERTKRDREESIRLLAQARDLFNQGNLEKAKELSYIAEKKHGPYSIWDIGDRPDRLRAEIARVELAQKRPTIPAPGTVQSPTPNAVAQNAAPKNAANDAAQLAAKQRVMSLLAEARQLQGQNRLMEAYAQALQAKQAAVAAQKMGVVFSAHEDTPDLALLQLGSLCRKQVDELLKQADSVATKTTDPGRLQKVDAILAQAKKLAQACGSDTNEIDRRINWVRKTEQVAKAAPTTPPTVEQVVKSVPLVPVQGQVNLTQQGERLLEDARRELRAGQTLLARKIAEEAFDPRYGVQKQAEKILRDIDIEEFEQRRLTAHRNADAVRDAFNHKDYQRAYQIAQSIDMQMLDQQTAIQLREILTMPEMQTVQVAMARGGPVQPAQGGNTAGKASISDQKPANNEQAGEKDFGDRYLAMQEILLSKLRRESLAAQNKANEYAKAGDFVRAKETLQEFRNRLETVDLPKNQIEILQRPLDRRLEQCRILEARADFEKNLGNTLEHGAKIREADRLKKQTETDRRIAELLEQSREFYREKKFEQAEALALQAKDLAPDNVVVNAAVQMASIAKNKKIFWDIEAKKADIFLSELNGDPRAHPTLDNPLVFDKESHERARRRGDISKGIQFSTLTEKEKEIERKLLTPNSFNFKDVPLRRVLEDLSMMSGINIIADETALKQHSISLDQPLSLHVENIGLKSALRILLDKVKLTYVIKDEVLQITTEDRAQGKIVTVTYPVADLVIPVEDSNHPGMTDLVQTLNHYNHMNSVGVPRPYINPFTRLANATPVGTFNDGSSGWNTPTVDNAPPVDINSAALGFGYNQRKRTIEKELIHLITGTISPESWSEVGGKGRIQYFPLGMGLVVSQTQDIQEQVFQLLEALRKLQDLQVAIEIRLISVSESFFEFMGVDFDVTFTTPQTKYEPQLTSGVFQPPGYVNRFRPANFVSGLTPAGTFTPDLNIPLNASSFSAAIPQLGGFPGTLGADGGLALGLAFLSDIQVFMFMEAAQGDRRANTMQAPRVTVFNGQTATLSVTDQIPFLLNISQAQAGDQIFFLPTQVGLPVGTAISVVPVVSANRQFVRLAVTQTMTNLISANVPLIPITYAVPNSFFDGQPPGGSAQPVITQLFLQQPSVSSIIVSTTVQVPDGGTVLLGGLKAMAEMRNEMGPPIIGKIPYIDRLFRNVGYGREAFSLLMMITPRIIISAEEELVFTEQIEGVVR